MMPHPALTWTRFQLRRMGRLAGRRLSFSDYPAPVPEGRPETVACRPALFDPDHLSRVTRCAFDTTVADLAEVLTQRQYLEGPLTTYPMGPATVIGGMVFRGGPPLVLVNGLGAGPGDVLARTDVRNDTVLANSTQGLMYFGHWLSDDVSAFEAFRDHPGLVSLPLPRWGDVPVYSELFGQRWHQQPVIRSRSLTLVRDLGFSRRKAARYRTLRGRLRNGTLPRNGLGRVVFLQRGPSGKPREIANLAELHDRLSAAGIAIVTAEGDSRALIAALLDATIIITIEGSQDRHAIYGLRDGGGMLTLAPPDRFYVATHEWARNLDMNSGMVIGTVAENGFRIDPDEVLRMVDRLLLLTENRTAV